MTLPAHDDEELFHRLLALDHSRERPWAPLHAVVVAAYLLQHSDKPISENDPNLDILRVFLSGGQDAVHALTAGRVRRNSHRAHGGPIAPPAGAMLIPPTQDFDTTISTVAVDGTFPAEGYEERVHAWAADTFSAWTN